jgi:hypothetical protein
MSLSQVYRHVASHAACSRSSYLEISRFFRTRHHGILTPRTAICLKEASRFFSNSRIQRDVIEPDEKLRKTLDDFKAASMSPALLCSQLQTLTPFSCSRVAGYIEKSLHIKTAKFHERGGRSHTLRLPKHATRCQQEPFIYNAHHNESGVLHTTCFKFQRRRDRSRCTCTPTIVERVDSSVCPRKAEVSQRSQK